MASVTSLDQDMQRIRKDRYTPSAANEVRSWVESTLGQSLAPGDLMDALKDGVALCKLVNMLSSPGVKYKSSNMPFVQMENISHFLRACELPPLNLPSHDRFLTVDLFDQKDPAQVLQCISAFSRRANQIKPNSFPTTIGGLKSSKTGNNLTPESTGEGVGRSPYTPKIVGYTSNAPMPPSPNRVASQDPPQTTFNSLSRGTYANPSNGRTSPVKSSGSLGRGGLASAGPVSSWSNKTDESRTTPAWNIHQYGYMGGASQGNLGVVFGGRRQITSPAPDVPSLQEKEKRLREKIEAEQRQQAESHEQEQRRQEEAEREAQLEEERVWEEETRKQREKDESLHRAEERISTKAKPQIPTRMRNISDPRLNGQMLSQYRSSQQNVPTQKSLAGGAQIDTHDQDTSIPDQPSQSQPSPEEQRIAELERQLAEARLAASTKSQPATQIRTPLPSRNDKNNIMSFAHTPQKAYNDLDDTSSLQNTPENISTTHRSQGTKDDNDEEAWDLAERDALRRAHDQYARANQDQDRQLPSSPAPPSSPPAAPHPKPAEPVRPLQSHLQETDPQSPTPTTSIPSEALFSSTAEQDGETRTRINSQASTRAGGKAASSLLEREMELERARQRVWEQEQRQTASRVPDTNEGSGEGQSWNIHQYGYMGGDNQGRDVARGLGLGGARRGIIGPRPMG